MTALSGDVEGPSPREKLAERMYSVGSCELDGSLGVLEGEFEEDMAGEDDTRRWPKPAH